MVSEGDFNFLGTGLPQYEEDEVVVRKAIGVHEQVVRDQQGRIRFHGAFTGGFSAGYFNTVDTKEGWTPQTFKSSRNERASHAQQKPEDFMDEEDTGEFGIAPKSLKATHEFRKHQLDVEDQLQLARLHIGTRMLRRMGWRKGEKLGERKRKKKTIHTAKVYGCSLPPALLSSIETENKEDEDSEEEDDDVDLREEDMCKVVFVTKSDLFGLGYRGMQEVKNTSKTPTKHRDRGQAFGVGAFEEEDEDVYNNDNLKNYNFHLSHDDDTDDHLRGWTAPKHHYDTKLKNVLRGFKKASEQTTSAKLFLPPDLPSNFKAFRSVFQDTQASTQVKDTHFRFHRPEFYMNRHYKRGELLGEKPRISSVFELLSEEDKARIEASKERRKSRGIDGGERKSRWSRGEEKHQEEVVREPEAVTEWEKEWKKPMNMMMASRFVKETGEASSEVKEEKKGVGREVVVEWHPAKLLCVRFNIEDPYPSSQIVGLLTSKQAKPSFFDMNTPISVVLGSHLIDQTPKKTSTQSSDKKKSTEEVLSKKTSDKKPLALLASVDFTAPSPSSNLKLISPDQPLKLIPPDQPPKPKFSDQPLNLIPPDIQRSRETHSQGAVETIKDDLVENFKSKPSIDVFKSIFESSDEYEEDVNGKNEEKSEKVEEESEVRDVLDDDKVAQELNEAPQKASINQDDGVWIEKSFKKDKKKKHKKEKKNKKKTKKKEKQKKKRASSSSSS